MNNENDDEQDQEDQFIDDTVDEGGPGIKANPPGLTSLNPARIAELGDIFCNFLKKKRATLWPWARQNGITCFRLYDRDMPDVPFVVDEYNKHLHISQIIRPKSDDEMLQDLWTTTIADAAGRAIGIPTERVFIKTRKSQKNHSQYEKFGSANYSMKVEEYGLQFEVNLSDYLDTGLFLDHRDTRAMVRGLAGGARVLNLFSYTGSFSVYAAAGGAASTLSVDLSNTYTAWAERNLAMNGFKSKLHTCIAQDVFEFLGEAAAKKQQYDIIILDPPTFSNSKKMQSTLDVQRDHPLLINQCLRILSKKGIIVFSNNLRTFKLNEHALNTGYVDDITFKSTPEDFKKRKPHVCYVLRKD